MVALILAAAGIAAVELEHRPVPPEEDDERRRYYGITEAGRQALVAEAERMNDLVGWVEAVLRPGDAGS